MKKLWAWLGIGGVSSGIGIAGAWGVCHTLCIAAIAALAAIGITITGMPFAFLNDYWWVFLGTGLLSITGSGIIFYKHRRHKNATNNTAADRDCCR